MIIDLTPRQADWLYCLLRNYECSGYNCDPMGNFTVPTRESAAEEKLRANIMKKLTK